MSQLDVNVIAPLDYAGPNLVGDNDNVQIINSVGNTVFKYETAARHVKIGSGVTSSTAITDSVSIGDQAMSSCTFNTNGPAVAIGSEALKNGVASGSNIAIGWRSLLNSDGYTGINNVAVGGRSGIGIVDGGNNTVIGHWAGTNVIDGTNNTIIGANASAASSSVNNSITIGNNQINVFRCNVQTITSLSDARDKKDVKELGAGLDFVKGLKPVEFVWDERGEDGKKDIKDFGFIAQDLKKSQEDAELAETLKLVYEENPEKLEASYGKLVPILVKAIQELSEEVKQLKNK